MMFDSIFKNPTMDGELHDFTTLADAFAQARSTNAPCIFNLLAVVMEAGSMRDTHGTDKILSLRVWDASLEDAHNVVCMPDNVQCNMFSSNPYLFPTAMNQHPGSQQFILCCVKIKAQFHDGKPQLLAKLDMQSRGRSVSSGFAYELFSLQGSALPYKCLPSGGSPYTDTTPSITHGVTQKDELLRQLRMEWQIRQSGARKRRAQISDLNSTLCCTAQLASTPEQFPLVTMTVKVLALDVSNPSYVVVHVWDGTHVERFPPGLSIQALEASDLDPELSTPNLVPAVRQALPLGSYQADGRTLSVAARDIPTHGSTMPLIIQRCVRLDAAKSNTGAHNTGGRGKNSTGRAPDLEPDVTEQDSCWHVPEMEPGSWVELLNIAPCIVEGQLQAIFYVDGSICLEKLESVQLKLDREGILRSRCQAEQPAFQTSYTPCPASQSSKPDESPTIPAPPVVTIRQAMMLAEGGDVCTHPFRLHCRLIRLHPLYAENCVRVATELHLSDEASQDGLVYLINMIVEDATGQLKLVLMGAEATHFFRGLSPALPQDTDACEKLDAILLKLQGASLDLCVRPHVWNVGISRQTTCYLIESSRLVSSVMDAH